MWSFSSRAPGLIGVTRQPAPVAACAGRMATRSTRQALGPCLRDQRPERGELVPAGPSGVDGSERPVGRYHGRSRDRRRRRRVNTRRPFAGRRVQGFSRGNAIVAEPFRQTKVEARATEPSASPAARRSLDRAKVGPEYLLCVTEKTLFSQGNPSITRRARAPMGYRAPWSFSVGPGLPVARRTPSICGPLKTPGSSSRPRAAAIGPGISSVPGAPERSVPAPTARQVRI